jgi:glucose-6-phosphate-specific signal transduction histidine kinase
MGGGTIVVENDLPHGQRFGRTVELTVYRIVQDAVALCRRANANRICVTLSLNNGILDAVIEGIHLQADGDLKLLGRRALMLLTARAQLVGGTVRTETFEATRRRIIVAVPADNEGGRGR